MCLRCVVFAIVLAVAAVAAAVVVVGRWSPSCVACRRRRCHRLGRRCWRRRLWHRLSPVGGIGGGVLAMLSCSRKHTISRLL